MSRWKMSGATALAAAVTLLASACSGSSSHAEKKTQATTTTTAPAFAATPIREISLGPLPVSRGSDGSSTGPIATADVDIQPSANHKLRVGFHETNVGTTGPLWEAVGRDAVAVATLITGAPLSNREIDFNVAGRLDGLGAGALMTVAVISLIRGDTLGNGITMIGTINPDGSIGPAGGSTYTINDAVAAHKTRVLVPVGGPAGLGTPGRARGVEVSAVSDVYDAYRQFTGQPLPELPGSTSTRLTAAGYDRIAPKVTSWLAKYQASAGDFQSLAPEVRQDLQSYADVAAQDRQRAQTLAKEGSQAGAFQAAVSAAALMNAIAQTGQSLQVLLTQGPAPFVARVTANQSIKSRVTELVSKLGEFKPESVSDVGALISAYGNAIDALSLSTFANSLFAAKPPSRQQAINDAAEGAIYFDVAGTLVDAAGDILSVGRGLGGATVGPRLDLGDVATFFRLAAEANLSAFQSVVIAPHAYAAKTSIAAAEKTFAGTDLDYALAQIGTGVVDALPPYFGGHATADYAALGGALALYERTSELIATYASLGRLDPKTQQVAGIGNAAAFNSVMHSAQSQLAANISFLRTKSVSSTTAVSDYEIAGITQSGTARDRFGALGDYWDGYLNSRVLDYFGAFPAP